MEKLSPDQEHKVLVAMKKTVHGMGEGEQQNRFIRRTQKQLNLDFNFRAWLSETDEPPISNDENGN